MTLSLLLWAFGLYIGLGGIVVAYSACVIAGRVDDKLAEDGEPVEYPAVTYTLRRTQDEQLALS